MWTRPAGARQVKQGEWNEGREGWIQCSKLAPLKRVSELAG
jgi:hypothetical protein